ncbi:hypothetical protein EI94DRAFT_1702367 [Lactarius quietus]|nr:hypothetical protein EI94DRAFT_1702367 [Lactarius quietus]
MRRRGHFEGRLGESEKGLGKDAAVLNDQMGQVVVHGRKLEVDPQECEQVNELLDCLLMLHSTSVENEGWNFGRQWKQDIITMASGRRGDGMALGIGRSHRGEPYPKTNASIAYQSKGANTAPVRRNREPLNI